MKEKKYGEKQIVGGLQIRMGFAPNKNCSRRHFIFYFYLSKEIRLDVSCEASA